jgi:hypothetical protein
LESVQPPNESTTPMTQPGTPMLMCQGAGLSYSKESVRLDCGLVAPQRALLLNDASFTTAIVNIVSAAGPEPTMPPDATR